MIKHRDWIKKLAGLILIFLLGLGTLPVQAQEGGPVEPFDDPELPGWERSPGVTAADSILRIEGNNFAVYSGTWGEMEMHIQMKIEGPGELILTYRKGEGTGYSLVFGPDYLLLFRELEGTSTVMSSVSPIPFSAGEWFLLELMSISEQQTILINGEVVIEALDISPLPPGGIGFEAIGEVSIEMEELAIISLGDVPLAEIPTQEPPADEEPESESDPDPTEEPTEQIALEPDPSSSDQFTWVRTGGPLGGIGYDIRYKFDQPTTWYVTDNFAGVHISTDDGLTWHPSNHGIPGQNGPTGDWKPIFSLTVDPHNPDIIWVGTDVTGHIYKSIDAGQSWVQKDNGIQQETSVYNSLTFRGFTVDPHDSNVVYAMAEIKDLYQLESAVWGTGFGGQVYKTADGGENWSLLWDGGIPSSLARYMWINPEDTDIMYVSTGIFDRGAVNEGKETDPNPYGGLGILKTTDGGKSWRVLNQSNGLNSLYVGSLFMHPDDPDILLAATGKVVSDVYIDYLEENNLTNPMGVYRTTDGGETWTQVLGEGGFNAVEICTADTNIAYAGNANEVYRSEDAGVNWKRVSGQPGRGWGPPGVLAGLPIDFQCDPDDPDRVFSNNYVGGNFLSEDGGKTWKLASAGYTGAQITSVQVDPTNPAQIYAAGRNGIWGSADGGANWYGMRYPPEDVPVWAGEWGGIAIDPENPKHLLASEETIWESFDGGRSWEVRPLPGPGQGVTIAFSPSKPSIVYAGGVDPLCVLYSEANCASAMGLYVSRDGGSTWEEASDANIANLAIIDIAVDHQDANHVYIATMNGLYETTNGGADWVLNANLPAGKRVSVITLHTEDNNVLMAGVEDAGLYISTNGGKKWNQAAAGIPPNAVIRDILYDPASSEHIYLTDVTSGVYRSMDGGRTWSQIINGLSNRAVTGLAISSDGMHLYAATNGEGVFRLDLVGQPPESMAPPPEISPSDPSEEGGLNPSPVGSLPTDEGSSTFLSLTAILLIAGWLGLLVFVILLLTRRKK
jgi:photosystem II stability/assembly factor-like uncharacterized protein